MYTATIIFTNGTEHKITCQTYDLMAPHYYFFLIKEGVECEAVERSNVVRVHIRKI